MAELQITGIPTTAAPNARVTKGSERFELLAVYASLDGSGAGGDFVPTVEIVSDSGRVVGRFPAAAAVAAGESVDVTFAPFLRNGVGLTGVFYDIVNTGRRLRIDTTESDPLEPVAVVFNLPVDKEFLVNSPDGTIISVQDGMVALNSSDRVNVTAADSINLILGGDLTAVALGGWSWTVTGPTLLALGDSLEIDAKATTINTQGNLFEVDTLGGTVQFNVQGGLIQFNNIGGDTSFENGSAGTWEADASQITLSRALVVQDALNAKVIETTTDTKLGFYAHAPVAQQTGVAVTAAAIHAALVNLGLITA